MNVDSRHPAGATDIRDLDVCAREPIQTPGSDLAARAIRRIIELTRYAANAAIGAGHLEPGMEVLTKPFNVEELVRRVRAIIDSN